MKELRLGAKVDGTKPVENQHACAATGRIIPAPIFFLCCYSCEANSGIARAF